MITINEASKMLGVTLRELEKNSKITSTRTEGGHRRYSANSILKNKENAI